MVDQKSKHKEGKAAASSKSCCAYEKAIVAKVSKLKGRIIKVIGNSFIISIAIRVIIRKQLRFKIGT